LALTDQQQALFMLLVFVLPAFLSWLGLGAPLDRVGLALLGSGIVSGILAYVKEALGTVSTPAPVQTPASAPK
jgi:hypothetical protein